MMKSASLFLFIFYATLINAKIDWRGHNKFFGQSSFQSDERIQALSLTPAHRSNIIYSNDNSFTFEGAYQLFAPLEKEKIKLIKGSDPQGRYRWNDIDQTLLKHQEGQDSFLLKQNLDRLYFSFASDFAELKIGRQAVNLGASRFVSPVDVLVPYDQQEILREDRVGVDAVKIRKSLGDISELEFGVLLGKKAKQDTSAFYFLARSNFYKTDFTLIGMSYLENELLGLQFAGSLYQAGYWIEIAYNDMAKIDYTRASTGLEYQINKDFIVMAEYHYNGAGKSEESNYLAMVSSEAVSKGAVYLLAKHYMGLGLTYQLTPLHSISASNFLNLNDNSTLLNAKYSWSFKQDLSFNAGACSSMNSIFEFLI